MSLTTVDQPRPRGSENRVGLASVNLVTPEQVFLRGAAVTRHFYAEVDQPSGPGWVPYRTVSTADGLADVIGSVQRLAPDTPPTVAAALFASSVAAGFAAPLTGALLRDLRVATPDPDRTWIHPAYTGVDAVATDRVTLTVLPDDPLTGQPGVVTVANANELRRAALSGYRALLEPLVERVAADTRRGRRALWADAGDRLATYLLLAGRELGDQRAGRREAEALLAVAEPPIRHRVGWLEFEHRGAPVIWKRRSVCCLVYQAPAWRGQYCATCPLIPEQETVRRTRKWLADSGA